MEKESGKSSVPLVHGVPNPFFNKASFLLSQQDAFKKFVSEVKNVGASCKSGRGGPGRFDFAQVKSKLDKTDFKERLKQMYDNYQQVRPAMPTMGPSPGVEHVYGRFATSGMIKPVAILDVGSGNCSKLVKYTGHLKISVNDQKLSADKNVLDKFDARYEGNIKDFLHVKVDFLTSFMSLCQIDKELRGEIYQRDGLHVLPDHQKLLSMGIAIRDSSDNEKIIVSTRDRVYVDVEDDAPGYPVEVGYKIVATYAVTNIEVNVTGEQVLEAYKPYIQAAPISFTDINFDDVSFKYDGVPYELEICGGLAMLTDRCGNVRRGSANFQSHMSLHLEDMGDRYVLFKIESYKGMVPPHWGNGLRQFLEKVTININGKSVVGPTEWYPGVKKPWPGFKEDGLITRKRESDYYCKVVYTADLYPDDIPLLKKKLEEVGKYLVCDVVPGLCEYSIRLEGSDVVMRFVRKRNDKADGTAISTVLYMLDMRDLGAMEAICGTPWKETIVE